MANITLPSGLTFDRVDFRPRPTVQVNRSQWNNARRVLDFDNGYFAAAVEIFANTENQIRLLRSFHAKLRGPANTFHLPVSECDQHSGGNPTVSSGGGAGATTVTLSGSPGLTEGQYATIPLTGGGAQLVLLTANISGSTLAFDPPLRAAAAAGGTVETVNPYGVMALPQGAPEPEDVNGVMTWAFEAEEAF